MSALDLALEILTVPGPCGGCRHQRRCAEQEIACQLFAEQVNAVTNQSRKRGRKPDEAKVPSRHWYEQVFENDADSMSRLPW
jgi:hypothetical protein